MFDRIIGHHNAAKIVSDEAKGPDLYQVFSYAIKRGTKSVYLLYPMFRFEDEEDTTASLEIPFIVDGSTHTIVVHIVRLPFIFEDDEFKTKRLLSNILLKIFSKGP